jgi:hypothetical protein
MARGVAGWQRMLNEADESAYRATLIRRTRERAAMIRAGTLPESMRPSHGLGVLFGQAVSQ